jgi:hypothetical protein
VVSIDYRDYMGSSLKFERFGACFRTCALIIWSVLLQKEQLVAVKWAARVLIGE